MHFEGEVLVEAVESEAKVYVVAHLHYEDERALRAR